MTKRGSKGSASLGSNNRALTTSAAPPCRPLSEWLQAIREERGLSFRDLAAETRAADPKGRGLNHSHIAGLTNGREVPGEHALELLAAALEIPIDSFAEYRLARFREQFDDRRVGPQRAWSNLESLERDLNGRARKRYGLTSRT
jgi:transcriptional regulator with XRE-family HTH domain